MTTEFIPATLNAVELYSDFRKQLDGLKSSSNALVFDYASPKGNKEARSHVFSLRKVGASLEKARKEAKSAALEYGRLVDSKAKEIDAEITTLIDVHDKPLREIEAK
jgi:colicin import membrane protein